MPRKKCSHIIRELEKVGLAAPQVTYIMHDLKMKGFPVGVTATTVEEAADADYSIRKTIAKKDKRLVNRYWRYKNDSRHYNRTILSGKKYIAQTGSKSEGCIHTFVS